MKIVGISAGWRQSPKLFTAGYAAYFPGNMKFVASQGGRKLPSDATVTATVG